MKYYQRILVLVFNLFYLCSCDNFIFSTAGHLQLGDPCDIDNNSQGICILVTDCESIMNNLQNKIQNHKSCGFTGNKPIVCCPTIENHGSNSEPQNILQKTQIKEGFQCIVSGTSENGVLKILKHCPEINEKVKNGLPIPSVCDFEVCRDLVCCPVKKSNRLKNYCYHVEDPDDEIQLRLQVNLPCTESSTNKSGYFQPSCPGQSEQASLNYACDRGVCDRWFCCPVDEISKKYPCTRLDPYSFTQTTDIVGPKCVDAITGAPGTCRIQEQCNAFKLNKELEMDECGSKCCTTFYCCPDDDGIDISVSQQKCSAYKRSSYFRKLEVTLDEPDPNAICTNRIVVSGGFDVIPGEYPHMAALGYYINPTNIEWNCGGSLISEKHVLTAGHCLNSRDSGPIKIVRLGAIHLTNLTATRDCPEDFNVAKLIPHPEYDPQFIYNDIALVLLDRKVVFNFHMRPICLPSNNEVPTDGYFGMGWGAIGALDKKSEKLLQIRLDSFTYAECNASYTYNVNRRFMNGIDESTQICAGSRDSIQSTCAGDSGGPIISFQQTYSNMHIIYGITSFGKPCGFSNNPDIYTKIWPYVKWIESVVWP